MKTWHRTAMALVAVCAGFLSQVPAALAEVKSAALSRGQNQVEGQKSTIALFMHPTSSLASLQYQGCTELESGNFRLEYTFHFRAWYGRSYTSNLKLTYFANGSLDYVAPGDRTALVPPFLASNCVFQWVKDRVAADPDVQNNQELSRLLAGFDARQLLEWWLKSGY